MRACEACKTLSSESDLSLSPAGQWLCRRCNATYESHAATHRARSAEVARRCSCGNVVMPMRHEDDKVYEGGRIIVFHPNYYLCGRCGTEYRTYHPMVTVMLVVALAAVIATTRRTKTEHDGMLGLIAVVILVAHLGYEIYKWFRYPRVS